MSWPTRASVRDAFIAFNEPFEGRVRHFYLDVKGLVTIGVGNLVDPVELAVSLPMYQPDGTLATATAIRAEWDLVKQNPHAARLGHRYAARLTRLRMRDEDINALVMRRLRINQTILVQRFPEFATWPADAQLATHSLAWACGPGFVFPKTAAALRRRDFATAAIECRMNETGNPGLRPRNEANRVLYNNAASVESTGADPEALRWPYTHVPLVKVV